ncbi:MAG TPA: DNA polymerase III subunit beta [Candidatus Polarisedimenticolaceae bacterium]|nr:DNA polymerase III subunit beta [Candidatus Polarisedimenticolaceae bacterium]
MEFVIKKQDLVRELQTVTGVVEKRATLPILANLLIEAGPHGLSVGASDLEVTIRGTAKATVVKPGSVTLPAGKLYEIARSLDDSDVQFKLLERHMVAISCERTRYRIAGQARDEFPKFPDLDVTKGIALPAGALREMIDRVGFAITTEDPRYSLHGALLVVQDSSLTLVATDGYRLAYASRRAPIKNGAGDVRVIVPRKALTEVGKLATEVDPESAVTFGRSGNHLFFTVGEHTLTTTVPEGSFPKYEEVMPKRCETEIALVTSDLTDAVKRVSLLASDRFGRAVRFQLTPGRLELSSETEMGEANESISVDYKGDEKTIGFNAKYLLDFLSVVATPSVKLELDPVKENESDADRKAKKSGDKPGQFKPEPAGELDYRYIVMPRDL